MYSINRCSSFRQLPCPSRSLCPASLAQPADPSFRHVRTFRASRDLRARQEHLCAAGRAQLPSSLLQYLIFTPPIGSFCLPRATLRTRTPPPAVSITRIAVFESAQKLPPPAAAAVPQATAAAKTAPLAIPGSEAAADDRAPKLAAPPLKEPATPDQVKFFARVG